MMPIFDDWQFFAMLEIVVGNIFVFSMNHS